MEILTILGLSSFNWINWMYLGWILNVIGIVRIIILGMITAALLSKSGVIKLMIFLEIKKSSQIRTIWTIMNYIIPYYTLYRFLIFLLLVFRYNNNTYLGYTRILIKMQKYDIGVKYDNN